MKATIPSVYLLSLIQKTMKLKSLFIIGTFLGGASFANADDKSFGDGTLPEFLVQYDVNEDGEISKD